MTRTHYELTLYERECPFDDYDTENGGGMPDEDVEPVELETATVLGTADDVAAVLADWGVSQWDGGRTAYDPDGSHMAADAAGTITERWARIEVVA